MRESPPGWVLLGMLGTLEMLGLQAKKRVV
jgi:hypothetical protein